MERSTLKRCLNFLRCKNITCLSNKIRPPDEGQESECTLKHYLLPFEPRIHSKLIPREFSDATEHIDFANIQDNDPMMQVHGGAPLNPVDTN